MEYIIRPYIGKHFLYSIPVAKIAISTPDSNYIPESFIGKHTQKRMADQTGTPCDQNPHMAVDLTANLHLNTPFN
jgi:hypothetical protein